MNQIVHPNPANKLLSPYRLGKLELPNRVVMAPLTRNRAAAGNVPTPLMAGVLRAARVGRSPHLGGDAGGPRGPGLRGDARHPFAAADRRLEAVTRAVHQKGGRIVLQLWHVGRVSHVSLQPGGQAPVAPSAIRAKTKTYIGGTFADVSEPRALKRDELPGIVQGFRQGAANALAAGFDGVEVHGANGYLLDQFLRDGSNKRDDDYGGSIENRARLMLEVLAAVIAEAGADRVGIRLSPVTPANDVTDSNPQAVYAYLIPQIDKLAPGYVHVIEGATGGPRLRAVRLCGRAQRLPRDLHRQQRLYAASARNAIESGAADLVAFGKSYLANPDLVARIGANASLNEPDKATFYGGGAKGYTDYPVLEKAL